MANTRPRSSIPIKVSGSSNPRPCTDPVRKSTLLWPVLTPSRRSRSEVATITSDTIQAWSSDAMVMKARDPATLSRLMAKAKRRKLRARRSKANHGRRPNAGRG